MIMGYTRIAQEKKGRFATKKKKNGHGLHLNRKPRREKDENFGLTEPFPSLQERKEEKPSGGGGEKRI